MPQTYVRTVQAGFGFSLLLLIATSVASFYSIRNLVLSSERVNHTNRVLQELENVISFAKDAETGQRGYLITGDQLFLEPYVGSYKRTVNSLDTLISLTQDNPSQAPLLQRLRTILDDKFKIMDKSIEKKLVEVDELKRGKVIMDEARTLVISLQ
ncbi:MAG: histidine kinase, partial [Pedobacter sp.]